jgi:hypothetical protein
MNNISCHDEQHKLSPMNNNEVGGKLMHENLESGISLLCPFKGSFLKEENNSSEKRPMQEFCEVNRTMVTRCGQCQISLFIFMAGVGK